MKFVHAADLHLDSPLRGLARYEGAPYERLRGATRHALENLVALCQDEQADLLLLAGDLYDGDWRDYSTGLFFAAQMSRLREAGTRVAWIRGNHDAASEITRHLRLPENVWELPTRSPGSVQFDDLNVAVHGQGFSSRAVTEDLARNYPSPVPGALNIGLLHTCATGRPGHQNYAPCAVESLVNKGYDYWALGHVHAFEVLSEAPWVVFSGNLQGRHVRESGPKGAVVVETDGTRIERVLRRHVDAVRWAHLVVDGVQAASADDLLDLARADLERSWRDAQGRPVAARVTLRAAARASAAWHRDPARWSETLRAIAHDATSSEVWLEKIRVELDAPEVASDLSDEALAELVRTIEDFGRAGPDLDGLRSEFATLHRQLPYELCEGEQGRVLDDPGALRSALVEVKRMLIARLGGEGEA